MRRRNAVLRTIRVFTGNTKKCSECLLQSQRQRLTANNSVALNSRIFANEQGKKANFIFREALSRLCGINSTAQTQRKELVFSTLCGCEPLQFSRASKLKKANFIFREALSRLCGINSTAQTQRKELVFSYALQL